MSLTGFYNNKQPVTLWSWYSRKCYYETHLAMALAKQRLQKMFAATEVDRMVDDVV